MFEEVCDCHKSSGYLRIDRQNRQMRWLLELSNTHIWRLKTRPPTLEQRQKFVIVDFYPDIV